MKVANIEVQLKAKRISLLSMNRTILSLLAIFFASFLFAQGGEQDLKAKASTFFQAKNYAEAMPLYGQLVSLYPTNSIYNYKYGACIVHSGEDKEMAVGFLEFATADPSISNQAWFYLGKAYHLNYRFNDALTNYRTFKTIASKKELMDLPVEGEITSARSGLGLLSELKDITVVDKVEVSEADFFRYFDLSEIGGKILVTPEEIKSNLDKKKKYSALVHYPEHSDAIYFASYGKDGRTGKDIYRTYLLPDGTFSEPQRLAGYVNSELDEEYPFMHPDGKSFYFSSKGHNSMGGYDVFKSVYDPMGDVFGPAQNLDFAINTPDDDLFYIVDSIYDLAYFASSRSSRHGKIHVYKVKNERTPVHLAIIKGTFISEILPSDKKAKIRVEDAISRKVIGEFSTDEADGSYVIVLPRGGKYRMIVEADQSTKTHVGVVDIPRRDEVHAFKQEISLVMHNDQEKLVIRNLFDEAVDEDLIALAIAEIKRRAELDVNFIPGMADGSAISADKTVEDASLDAGFRGDLSNDDIVNMAFEDAAAIEREAMAIGNRADLAFTMANDKVAEAKTLVNEADKDVQMAEATENLSEKEALMANASKARTASEKANSEGKVAFELAASLEIAQAEKAEEAAIATVYARELESAINSNSYEEAFKKLSEQKEQIEASSGPNSKQMDVYEAARQKAIDKQDEADKAMVRANSVRDEEKELRSQITRASTQLEGTNSKSKKEEYQAEIDAYEADLEMLQTDIDRAFDRASDIQEQADLLDAQAQLYYSISAGDDGSEPAEAIVLSDQQKQQLRKDIASNEEQINAIDIDELIIVDAGMVEANSDGPEVKTETMTEEDGEKERENTSAMEGGGNDAPSGGNINTTAGVVAGAAVVTGAVVASNDDDDTTETNSDDTEVRTEESGGQERESTSAIDAGGNETATNGNSNTTAGVVGSAAVVTGVVLASSSDDPKEEQSSEMEEELLATVAIKEVVERETKRQEINEAWVDILDGDIEKFDKQAEQSNDPEEKEELLRQADELSDMRDRKELEINESEGIIAGAGVNAISGKRNEPIRDKDLIETIMPEHSTEWESIANSDLQEHDKFLAWSALDNDLAIKTQEEIAQNLALVGEGQDDENVEENITTLRALDKRTRSESIELQRRAEAISTQLLAAEDGTSRSTGSSERAYVVRTEHEDIYASEIEFRSKKAERSNESSSEDRVQVAELGVEIAALEASMDAMTEPELREETEKNIYKLRDEQLILNTDIGQRSAYQNREEFDYNMDSLKTQLSAVKNNVELEVADPTMAFVNEYSGKAETKFNESKELRKQADREKDLVQRDLLYREAYSIETRGLQDLDQAITASNYILDDEFVPNKEVAYKEMEAALFDGSLLAVSDQTNDLDDQDVLEVVEPNRVTDEEHEELASSEQPNEESQQQGGIDTNSSDPNIGNEAIIAAGVVGVVAASGSSEEDEANGSGQEAQELENNGATASEEVLITTNAASSTENEESVDTELTSNGMEQNTVEASGEQFELEYSSIGSENMQSGDLVRIGSGLVVVGDPNASDPYLEPLSTDKEPLLSEKEFKHSDEMEVAANELLEQARILRDSSESVRKKEREPLVQRAEELETEASELQEGSQELYLHAMELQIEEVEVRELALFERDLRINYNLSDTELEMISTDETLHYYFEIKVKAKNAEAAAIHNYIAEEDSRKHAKIRVEGSRNLLFAVDTTTNEDVRKQLVQSAGRLNDEAIVLNDRADSLKREAKRNEFMVIRNNKMAEDHLAKTDQKKANELRAIEQNAVREPAYRLVMENDVQLADGQVVMDKIETADGTGVTITRRAPPPKSAPTTIEPTEVATAYVDPSRYEIPETLVADIFTTRASDEYSDEEPIPVDPPMPAGLVYKIQVGAFRNPIDQNLYDGFAPVMGEKLDNGITRYTAGLFASFSSADLAKELIRDLGYSDAFVVAFMDGKRVSMSEARAQQEQLAQSADSQELSPDYQTLGTDENSLSLEQGIDPDPDVPELTMEPNTAEELLESFQPDADAADYYNDPSAVEATQVEVIKGLFYTVQVGVYSKPVPASAIFNLEELNSQRTESGLIRYTSGRFSDVDSVRIKKNQIVLIGVSDAFITAYMNGERITMNKAALLLQQYGPSILSTE